MSRSAAAASNSMDTLEPNQPSSQPLPSDEATIRIGRRILPTRYFLAPLAGYTTLPFRRAIRALGGLGLATTDLVLATGLLSKHPASMDRIATIPGDRPLSVQIFSGVREELIDGARWLQDAGYESVDLNMGCPMAKVNGYGGGARLLCDADGACETVEQVVQAVTIPVTVKMRLGWDNNTITAPALAARMEDAGVAAITIHGRTRQQGFRGDVDLDGIAATVDAVRSIPVIGNGDVRSAADAIQMRQYTGCAAVAIGRGALLDPWIFAKLRIATDAGDRSWTPTPRQQIDFLVHHFDLMIEQHAEFACVLFRKFAMWYGVVLGIPEALEDRLRRCESINEFNEIVDLIREQHGTRQSSTPTALLKTPNGPVERW